MSTPGGSGPKSSLLFNATLVDLEDAWQEREQEARVLLSGGHNAIGLALLLYSLEIRLKTRICKHLKLSLLPKACKTHDLSELIIFTGLFEELQDPANATIRRNWDRLEKFSKEQLNDLRYNPQRKLTASELAMMLVALDDPALGVLAWLSKHP
jgi:hypothetical protein